VSLGSILLLAALGLAITYRADGVINMAPRRADHDRRYTTYVVQETCFKKTVFFDWYLSLPCPAAFLVAAAVAHDPGEDRHPLGSNGRRSRPALRPGASA